MIKIFKAVVKRTPLYSIYRYFAERYTIKNLHHRFWEWTDDDQKRFDFYGQFINKGDVVIDVGANLGNRSKVFYKLGAVVVAIEPQAKCADFLQDVFKNKNNFHLIRKALGASTGEAEMLISNAHTISTLSSDWVSAVKESGRFSEYKWNRKVTVQIDTLDNIIKQYGYPVFIKIDVEGFEDQVLSGLSSTAGALSMEFTPEFMGSILKCIEHLNSIADWEFQISVGESMEYELLKWVSAEEVKESLSKLPQTAFGDLYARLAGK